MDFILPDDATMDIMRKEFNKLKLRENALAFAFADSDAPDSLASAGQPPANPAHAALNTYITAVLLLLYFVKHIGYNTRYGTQIFDADGSMERLQSVGHIFRQLNDLG